MAHRLLRWLPAAVAPVLVAGAAVAVPMSAGASSGLPAKSAEQVLALIAKSEKVSGFSGTVQQTSDLGLPTLPTTSGMGGDSTSGGSSTTSSAASAVNLLTGTHTARVYVSGSTDRRVQVLDSMGERDVIQSGRSVWTWDSVKKAATHLTLPTITRAHAEGSNESPADVAKQLLAAVRPSSTVTPSATDSVAGRSAYGLTLTPRTTATLVGHVTLAVDAATGLPLRVQVFAKGASSPALSTEFTQLNVGKPAASLFHFTPGKDVKVTEKAVPQHRMHPMSANDPATMRAKVARLPKPSVTGTGWDSVVSTSVGTLPTSVTGSSIYRQLTDQVAGGRVLKTSLVSVLLTDDGHVYAGAVPVSRLQAVAAQR